MPYTWPPTSIVGNSQGDNYYDAKFTTRSGGLAGAAAQKKVSYPSLALSSELSDAGSALVLRKPYLPQTLFVERFVTTKTATAARHRSRTICSNSDYRMLLNSR